MMGSNPERRKDVSFNLTQIFCIYSLVCTASADGNRTSKHNPCLTHRAGKTRAIDVFINPEAEAAREAAAAEAAAGVPSAEEIAQTTVNKMPAYLTIAEMPAYLTIDLVILIIAVVVLVIGLLAYMALRKQK